MISERPGDIAGISTHDAYDPMADTGTLKRTKIIRRMPVAP
jgi:hypothetical protein